VIPAIGNGRSQLPVREVCHCHPCPVPALTGGAAADLVSALTGGAAADLVSDTDTTAVQSEGVTGDLGVKPLAAMLFAQLDRGVGKRRGRAAD
jgi:hypothetical protein